MEIGGGRTTRKGFPAYWYRHLSKELWLAWLADYAGDEELAIAHAIWQLRLQIANKKRSSQLKYISLRDHFVKLHLGTATGAQVAIVNEKCWHCEGSGIEPGRLRKRCTKCGGSKLYKTYTLYLHTFMIAGKRIRLQSGVVPVTLQPLDLLQITEEGQEWFEVDKPPLLPFGGILRVMSYVAVAKWRLMFISGKYQEPSNYAKTNKAPKGGARKTKRGGKG